MSCLVERDAAWQSWQSSGKNIQVCRIMNRRLPWRTCRKENSLEIWKAQGRRKNCIYPITCSLWCRYSWPAWVNSWSLILSRTEELNFAWTLWTSSLKRKFNRGCHVPGNDPRLFHIVTYNSWDLSSLPNGIDCLPVRVRGFRLKDPSHSSFPVLMRPISFICLLLSLRLEKTPCMTGDMGSCVWVASMET